MASDELHADGRVALQPATAAATSLALAKLLDRTLSVPERLHVLRRLAGTVAMRAKNQSHLAQQAATVVEGALEHLPIRTSDTLRAEYGDHPEVVAEGVIGDAARLARWLWSAAAVAPGPPGAIHVVKVVAHSVIEIRLIGELYTVHGDPTWRRDRTWLNAVLTAWATGCPIRPDPPSMAGVRNVATKIRQSYQEFVSGAGRLTRIADRGREGGEAVRQTGWRHHRRMRLHPSMWNHPDTPPAAAVHTQAITAAVVARAPVRDRGQPVPSNPTVYLGVAWASHYQARYVAARAEPGPNPAVGERLQSALAAQEGCLRRLAEQLGTVLPVPSDPTHGEAVSLVRAHEYASEADIAIDQTEDAGARPRRLASWPPRARNGLVYLMTAAVVSTPMALPIITGWTSPSWVVILFLTALSLALPWATVAIGVAAIAKLFRPWLGGRVPRSPFLGLLIAFATHVTVAVGSGLLVLGGD